MSGEIVRVETVAPGVARLVLCRSEKRNALSTQLVVAAIEAIDQMEAEGFKVGILASEGTVFCAGVDITHGVKPAGPEPSAPELLNRLLSSTILWIAAMQGPALGAGVALVAACPLSVAARGAWFALPEIDLGLFPTAVLAYLEPRLGTQLCVEWGLLNQHFNVADPEMRPLVSIVAEPGELDETVARVVKLLAESPVPAESARLAWQAPYREQRFWERKRALDDLLRVPNAEGSK